MVKTTYEKHNCLCLESCQKIQTLANLGEKISKTFFEEFFRDTF